MDSLLFHFQAFSKVLAVVGAVGVGLFFVVAVISVIEENTFVDFRKLSVIVLLLMAIYGGYLWIEGFLK